MKAIVLTCDKYIKITDHMIAAYQKLWYDNPFIFRVPYNQTYPSFLEQKYGKDVELIETEKPIKPTVLKLISDLDEEEWIYWCMDDHYPTQLNCKEIQKLYHWLIQQSVGSEKIASISCCRTKNLSLKAESLSLKDLSQPFLVRKNYKGIWMHQFMKVKALRHLFSHFPDDSFSAKAMDNHKRKVTMPEDQVFLVSGDSLIILAESTHRGKLTGNCLESFQKYDLEIPSNFEIAKDRYIIRGDYYYQKGYFMSLVRQLQSGCKKIMRNPLFHWL